MTGVIESRLVKEVNWVDYLGALTANSYGYCRFTVPNDVYALLSRARVILSTTVGLIHPSPSGGLVLTCKYGGGTTLYTSYYTPRAVTLENSDIMISIAYI